jgi:hypothetical protein
VEESLKQSLLGHESCMMVGIKQRVSLNEKGYATEREEGK